VGGGARGGMGGGGMMGGGARGGMGGGGMRGGGGMMGGGARGGMGGGGMRGGGGMMGGGARGGMGGGGMRGGGGMMGGGARGGMGGGGMRGGAARGGLMSGAATGRAPTGRAPTRPGAPAAPGAAPTGEKALTTKNLRLVLFTDEGVIVADPVAIGLQAKDKRGWLPVSVSLARFKGPEGAKQLRAVGLFSEQSDVFYLGQLRLLVDRTPVRAAVKAEPAITRTGQVIDFSVELSGGPVDPQISWDFGESDEVKQQAVGARVKYVYKKAGDYLVTCTVADRGGVRGPLKASSGVHIEEAPKAEQ